MFLVAESQQRSLGTGTAVLASSLSASNGAKGIITALRFPVKSQILSDGAEYREKTSWWSINCFNERVDL